MKMSVAAIVIDDNRFLAIKRRDVPIWVLPGGGVDKGETPESAIVREVLEETGLKVEILRKVAEYSPINKLATLTHLYECSIINGIPSIGAETRAIGFFDYKRPPDPFFYVHADMLQDALRHEPFTIKKPFSQVTYWAFIKYFVRHPLFVIRFLCSKAGFPMNSK